MVASINLFWIACLLNIILFTLYMLVFKMCRLFQLMVTVFAKKIFLLIHEKINTKVQVITPMIHGSK
jgi:hypothetical protein